MVVASLSDGRHKGRGECVPYARYGESVEAVVSAIAACAEPLAAGLSRAELASLLPAGAARNGLDCALWDLEAKRSGLNVATLAGMGALQPVLTAFTLSLAAPDEMATRARKASETIPSQPQARRRRRHRPARRGACGRPAGEAHRRCQRGLATR